MGKEIPLKELTKFAIMLVAVMRGHADGIIYCSQLKDWTKEELHGTADLLLEGVKEKESETMQELQSLYQETGGKPFKEEYYAR